MTGLFEVLEKSQKSCESISTLYFRPRSIFVNSMVKNREITNLITDLNVDILAQQKSEKFLKYDSAEKRLRRFDGLEFIEDDQYYLGEEENEEIIKIPKTPKIDEFSMATNMSYINKLEKTNADLLNLITNRQQSKGENGTNKDIDLEKALVKQMIELLIKLNNSYPINNLESYINKIYKNYKSLNDEIEELVKIAAEINEQLKKFHVNLNEKELLQFKKRTGSHLNSSGITGKQLIEEKKKILWELQQTKLNLEKELLQGK